MTLKLYTMQLPSPGAKKIPVYVHRTQTGIIIN